MPKRRSGHYGRAVNSDFSYRPLGKGLARASGRSPLHCEVDHARSSSWVSHSSNDGVRSGS